MLSTKSDPSVGYSSADISSESIHFRPPSICWRSFCRYTSYWIFWSTPEKLHSPFWVLYFQIKVDLFSFTCGIWKSFFEVFWASTLCGEWVFLIETSAFCTQRWHKRIRKVTSVSVYIYIQCNTILYFLKHLMKIFSFKASIFLFYKNQVPPFI